MNTHEIKKRCYKSWNVWTCISFLTNVSRLFSDKIKQPDGTAHCLKTRCGIDGMKNIECNCRDVYTINNPILELLIRVLPIPWLPKHFETSGDGVFQSMHTTDAHHVMTHIPLWSTRRGDDLRRNFCVQTSANDYDLGVRNETSWCCKDDDKGALGIHWYSPTPTLSRFMRSNSLILPIEKNVLHSVTYEQCTWNCTLRRVCDPGVATRRNRVDTRHSMITRRFAFISKSV